MGMTPLFLSVRSDQIRAMQIRFSGGSCKITWEILRDKTEPDATKLTGSPGSRRFHGPCTHKKGYDPPMLLRNSGGFSVAFYDAKMRSFEAQNVLCCRWGVMHDPVRPPTGWGAQAGGMMAACRVAIPDPRFWRTGGIFYFSRRTSTKYFFYCFSFVEITAGKFSLNTSPFLFWPQPVGMDRVTALPSASRAKFRDIPVDLLRGIAITLMIGANTVPYLLLPPVPFAIRVLSLAAPLFILLSGMMVTLSRSRKQYGLGYFLIRGALVIMIAAGLEAVAWGSSLSSIWMSCS